MIETGAAPDSGAAAEAELANEIRILRRGLWECYVMAGGDPHNPETSEPGNEELMSLVVDCVRDLRGFFEAARRDVR